MFMGGAEALIGLFFFGIGLPLGVPPAEQDPLMQRVAPEKCLYYTTWAGMAKPDGSSGNATEALLAEPEVQHMVQALEKAMRDGFSRALADEEDPDAELAAKMVPLCAKNLLTSPTAIYVTKLNMQPHGPPDIQAAAIANSGEHTAKIRDALLKVQTRHLGDRAKEVQIAGAKFYQFRPAEDAPLITWGVRGKYFVLGLGEDALESLFENARTGPPAWLTELQEQLPVERTSTITYANLSGLIDGGIGGLEEKDRDVVRKVIAALGLSNVRSYEAVSGLEEKGFITRTLLEIEGESRGIFALADAKPLTVADLSQIPQDATAAVAFRLDSRKVLDTVQSVAREVDPDAANELDANLDSLTKMIGMSLRDEVLAGLGDTWCIYNSQSEGGLLFTGVTATIDIKDKAKVDKAHAKLLALAKAVFREPDHAEDHFDPRQPKLKNIEFQGRTIHYLTGFDEEFPFAPAWCLTDTHLMVSLFPQNIEAMLARDESFKSLAAVPAVAANLKAESGPLSITYFDMKTLFELLYPMAQMGATAALNNLAEREGIDLDASILPRTQTISRHLAPSVTTLTRTKRGLEFTSRQTLPGSSAGSTTPVAVALLLPAINAAREAARRNGSMNNIRQLGLGILNFESATKRFPAQAMKTADGKPGLSWRVQILPFIEERILYDEFHHDEPWDSEHNKKLIERMPVSLRSPKSSAAPGLTTYLAVVGEDSLIAKGTEGNRIRAVKDGISKTIMLVEADDDRAVIWTKPDDFEYDGMKPAAGLGGMWSGGIFLAVFADCHAQLIHKDIDPKVLNALFTKGGGEAVGLGDISVPARQPRIIDEKPAPRDFEEERIEAEEEELELVP